MGQLYKLDFANGKSYIGITKHEARRRFRGHKASLTAGNKGSLLYDAWRKHGEPQLVVLAVVEDADLPASEIRAIKAFNTLVPNGYNISEGGNINPMHSDAVRAKLSAANKGKKPSEQCFAASVSARTGKCMSEETKAKMSLAAKGKPKSDAHRASIKASWVLRKLKQEKS